MIVGAGVPVAVAAKETLAAQVPGALETLMFAGHVIAGPAFTCSVAVVKAESLADVEALTRNVNVPPGVPAVVVSVSVVVAESDCEGT